MKVRFVVLSLLILAVAFSASAVNLGSADTGRYVVVFKSQPIPSDAAARIVKNGGKAFRILPEIGVAIASGNAKFVARMAKDSKVAAIGAETMYTMPEVRVMADTAASAEDGPLSADFRWYYQWDMRRINAPAVWDRFPLATDGRIPTVAVIDTGVADDHIDLAGQVAVTRTTSYCPSTGGLNNSPSYPKYATLIDFDAYPSWDPTVNPCTPVTAIYEGHGTHVAGTIAAKFGGGRAIGVAPDAQIWAYKVFDRYRYTDGTTLVDRVSAFDGPIFAAIVDAANNGAPVITMSLGSHVWRNDSNGNASWLAWDRVAKYANRRGTLIVASAGNSEVNLNGTVAHIPSDLSTVMSTSASAMADYELDEGGFAVALPGSDYLASYSNYGSSVDISAPGGDCPPALPCYNVFFIYNDYIDATGALGYSWLAGTSMATPHVSAVAAWVRALHPTWTPGQVRDWLKTTAQPVGPRQFFGAGIVDADLATQ